MTCLFLEEHCPDFKREIRRNGIEYIIFDSSAKMLSPSWCSEDYFKREITLFLQNEATLVKTVQIAYPHSLSPERTIVTVLLFRVDR